VEKNCLLICRVEEENIKYDIIYYIEICDKKIDCNYYWQRQRYRKGNCNSIGKKGNKCSYMFENGK
jgi:hypothetical protein